MKVLYLLISIVFLFSLDSMLAQEMELVKFDDGTEIEVQVINTTPDDVRKLSLYLGLFGPDGTNIQGVSYYLPRKALFDIKWGYGFIEDLVSFNASTTIILKSIQKERDMKVSLKTDNYVNSTVNYVTKIPSNRQTSFGLRLGAGKVTYFDGLRRNHISFGGSMLRTKHLSLYVPSRKNKPLELSSIGALHFESVFYSKPINFGFDGVDHVDKTDIGIRLYYEKGVSFWGGSGRFGFRYMIGAVASRHIVFDLTGGFGISYMLL